MVSHERQFFVGTLCWEMLHLVSSRWAVLFAYSAMSKTVCDPTAPPPPPEPARLGNEGGWKKHIQLCLQIVSFRNISQLMFPCTPPQATPTTAALHPSRAQRSPAHTSLNPDPLAGMVGLDWLGVHDMAFSELNPFSALHALLSPFGIHCSACLLSAPAFRSQLEWRVTPATCPASCEGPPGHVPAT